MRPQDPSGRARWRDRRRSIRFIYAAILAVPLLALAALLAFAGTSIGAAITSGSQAPSHGTVLIRIAVADAIGLVAVLIAVAGMGWFVRRLSHDVSSLEGTARQFADQLPQLAEQLRRGDDVDLKAEVASPAPMKITEMGRVAEAFSGVQRKAVESAAAEASLRSGISQVFVSLARRSQSLLQRQLRQLDELERKATDPGALADLFPLDHLTTRMRRHAEGLIILSGAVPGRAWSSPVPVIDVIRGAIAEVEDYKRVAVVTDCEDTMAGSAVADMIHLLAELIENATLFSPSGTRVEVRAERVGNGFAVEVEDRGLGIGHEDLETINERLASPQDFDMANADQLGLFVVGKLAARHGVRVTLRRSPYGGITAIAVMPRSMVSAEGNAPAAVPAAERPAIAAGAPSGDLLLALTGRKWSRVSPAGSIFRSPPTAIPAQPDGVLAEPISGVPVSAQHIPGEPITGMPIPAQPVPVESAPAQPIQVEPIPVEPIPAEPIQVEPIQAWPIPAEPIDAGPIPAEPTSAGPIPVEPIQAPAEAIPAEAIWADFGDIPRIGAPPDDVTTANPFKPGVIVPEEPPAVGTHRGLPRRVRQANLSPHLRNSPRQHAAPAFEPVRTPEQAKSLLASLQSGWERGRQTETTDSRPPSAENPASNVREAPPEEK
jgi:signal transduction histidine kinase